MAEPSLVKERKLKQLPIITKSSTLKLEPSRDIPYMLSVLPRRTQDRMLKELPSITKSSTARLDPSRDIP
jgi:hypothetical protein